MQVAYEIRLTSNPSMANEDACLVDCMRMFVLENEVTAGGAV